MNGSDEQYGSTQTGDRPVAERVIERARASVRGLESAAAGRIGPVIAGWWSNPLLRHARRQKPLRLSLLRNAVLALASVFVVLSVIAWVTNWRPLGAALIGLSLGAVLAPALIAAPASADRVARQMRFTKQDPRRLADLDPQEVVWGLALVTLWRLRWLIAAGLALTPALIVGVLRIDIADYTTWQTSAEVLGDAAGVGRTALLRPDGGIPYTRVIVHALSAGITPWVALPLAATLGVTAALALRDPSLSPLAALLGAGPAALLLGAVWRFTAQTPLLAGNLEVARMLLLVCLWVGLVALTMWANRWNSDLLTREARFDDGGADELLEPFEAEGSIDRNIPTA